MFGERVPGTVYTGPIGATGASDRVAVWPSPLDQRKVVSPSVYPYSAISRHAKQAEDREAEIERIARLLCCSIEGKIDSDQKVLLNTCWRTSAGHIVFQNDAVVSLWETYRFAAEAVYEDRRK